MAAWKPKEKELTVEEAVALARKELAPSWHGSPPLLAGVIQGDGVAAYPLDKDFTAKPWLLAFVDPMDLEGRDLIAFARELHERYAGHGLAFLLALHASYSFLRDRALVEELVAQCHVRFPVVMDADGMLHRAFGATASAMTVLLEPSGRKREDSAPGWQGRLEKRIQDYLRESEPGLPLLREIDIAGRLRRPVGKVELGAGRGARFPAPGFTVPMGALMGGRFVPGGPGAASTSAKRPLPEGMIRLKGQWMQDAERIGTSDPEAELIFTAPAPETQIIACSLAKTSESCRISVEAGGLPIYDAFRGKDLGVDDEGQTVVRIGPAAMYSVLQKLPPEFREVTFRFPMAARVPAAIYGLRFAETGSVV